ncbi:AfsR/SARP family transcriptional regulator [Streptomyces salyersiae]|uniref:BTAD domain-containing putative transcriptional regulator n=1 Tax=Streptomyces salyersiae TaxID=3075530 RepID=A0ABU2RUQ1_9ACTN|nr:BTAD domain-containing putative transcriptional regulator [Streptomyces sp. DSM 41770]MDT0432563.1 BTAD domain-containing putative transcriptional regulator [Streptomyces sp. DSM 41770]
MRYLILGVTEARDENGGPLPVGGPRLRALLTALALRAGRPADVAALVEDVWDGDRPHDAPAALQALVGRLRRVLGKEAVPGAPAGYRLDAGPDDIDLYVFERLARRGGAELASGDAESAARTLRTALALWRGPALADLPGAERAYAVRARAHQLTAVRQRVEADFRRGALTGLVPELRELTTAHPYDEPLHAQLVRVLRAEGRQADALLAYEEARRSLADGLGADPGPELTALHRELLNPAPPRQTGPPEGHGRAAPVRPVPGPAAGPDPGYGHADPGRPPSPGDRASGTRPRHPGAGPAAPAAPDPAHEGNIRPRLTSFVGRADELRDIRADLTRARLVTLTGPGGSGKTRLAEEAAAGQGAWIAELAPLDDPAAVPGAVLTALGLRETALLRDTTRDGTAAPDDPTGRLVEHLAHRSRTRPFLLLLDNCEHVVEAAATLAETLLTHCPGLRVLATSREPLGVPGEAVRPVGPLPPDPAHRLFAERARAVRPDFEQSARADGARGAVAEICRRLDGLPLAIELAAARLRLLTPRQIADRLDDRFRLLTSGSRTVLPRQQTLRAVVDWSWDLLEEDERTVLRQVSVFAGGWDLTAAEAVTAGPDTAALLGALVDKSLVVATPSDTGEMRYRLLETIHEYAAERAAETPRLLADAAAAHTAHFGALARKADPLLRSADQLSWIRRLEADLDNIRAALHRTVVTAPDEPEAVRLVLAMGWFWWLRNLRSEGLGWADRTAALGEDPEDPEDPLHWPRRHLHILRFFLAAESNPVDDIHGDEELQSLVSRVTEDFRVRGGPQAARFPGVLWPLTGYMRREDTPDVRAHFDAAVANARAHGGDWEYAVILMFRTHMLVDTPRGMDGVDEDLAELRVLGRRIGDRYLRAQVASAAAEVGMTRGRYEESRAAYAEALELAREIGAHAEEPFLVARLAELAHRTGDLDTARAGLDEAEAAAERQRVYDARAYIDFLRASVALTAGDLPQARRFVDRAGDAQVYGSRPPQFTSAVTGLSARITVLEPSGGPVAGLRGMTEALGTAVAAGCAEVFTAQPAEAAGITLCRVGNHAAAARVLAAAEGWREQGPRTAVEEGEVAAALELVRDRLGPVLYAAEWAAGQAMTPADAVAFLADVTEELSGS